MAYILEINDRIIDTKTNPKPTQNQLKNDNKMGCKIYSCEIEFKCSSSPNTKILNFIPYNSSYDQVFLRIIIKLTVGFFMNQQT